MSRKLLPLVQVGASLLLVLASLTTGLAFNPQATWAAENPSFWASVDTDSVEGQGYDPGASITITTFSNPGGSMLKADTVTADNDGHFWYPNIPTDFAIDPGMRVEVTDGNTLKTLDVIPVTVDELNSTSNIARGTAPAGTQVLLEMGSYDSNPCNGDLFFNGQTLANEVGQWSIDVGAAGSDILAHAWAVVRINDPDGDSTRNTYHQQNYRVFLHTDEIWAGGEGWWDANSTVAITIYGTNGVQLFAGTAPTDKYGNFTLPYASHGIDLRPNMRVLVADSDDSLETQLLDVSWDSLDPATGLAQGNVPAGTIPCAMGELYVDEAGSDAGKGLWNLAINGTHWSIIHDLSTGFPNPDEIWGNIGFDHTFATYRPGYQALDELRSVVTLFVTQGELTAAQATDLIRYLDKAYDALRPSQPTAVLDQLMHRHNPKNKDIKTAKKALKDFIKQVNKYERHDQLSELRAAKLTSDAEIILTRLKP